MTTEDRLLAVREKYAQGFVHLFMFFIEQYHPDIKTHHSEDGWRYHWMGTFGIVGALIVKNLEKERSQITRYTINRSTGLADSDVKDNFVRFEFVPKSDGHFACRLISTDPVAVGKFGRDLIELTGEGRDSLLGLLGEHGFGEHAFQLPWLVRNSILKTGLNYVELDGLEDAPVFYTKLAKFAIP